MDKQFCPNHTWVVKAPIYINFRKHNCPECKSLLRVVKRNRIVLAGSEEARKLGAEPSMFIYQSGKLKVHWKEFECPQCGRQVSVAEMKRLEGYPD